VRIPSRIEVHGSVRSEPDHLSRALAYFTPLGDIRLFDGDNDIIVSNPVRNTIKAFNYTQRAKTFAAIDPDNDQVIWIFASGVNTEPDTCAVWNYRYGVWYIWKTLPMGHLVSLDTSDDASLLLSGENDITKGAYIYKFLDGSSFDGSNIEAAWMTKVLYGVNEKDQPALSNTKRWRWMDLVFKVTTSIPITVGWFQGTSTDDAAPLSTITANPTAATIRTIDGSDILTADGSFIGVALLSAQIKSILHDTTGGYLHDTGMRLKISSNDQNGQWYLEAMQIAFQSLPGMNRRNQ
jgi:hypothetical protein